MTDSTKHDYIEYDAETLQHLQSVLLEMLSDFVYACDKHNIEYFGVGGTAIGAVRHGGMIPWDDDIDIGYRRRDEKRVIEAVKEEFGDKYWFANPELIPGFPYLPTHMCLSGTEYREKVFDDYYQSGIFLDLYPFDDVYTENRLRKKQGWTAWFWGKLYTLYFASRPVLFFGGAKAKLVLGLCKIGNKLLHLLRINPQFFYKKAVMHSRICEKDDRAADYMAWLFDPMPFDSLISKEIVFPVKPLDFNGRRVTFPRDVEKYLSVRYGDYMTIPPVNQRHNHPPAVLSFGAWSKTEECSSDCPELS